MLARLLGLKDAESINYFHGYLRHPWPVSVAMVLIACAIGYVAWLYYRERGLTRRRRLFLGGLRAAILGGIVLMLFEPAFGIEATVRLRRVVLVLLDRSESMARQDARQARADLEDAAVALGKVKPEIAATAVLDAYRGEISAASRIDLARSALSNQQLPVFGELARENTVRYFTFGQQLEPAAGEGEAFLTAVRKAQANDKATALGSAITQAVARYPGQPLAVVVLSDGASNQGLDPLEVAARMKDRNVPLYTVGVGLSDPPDVKVADVIVPDTVFSQDQVTVRVRVESSGFDRQSTQLRLTIDNQEVARKAVMLAGGTQFEQLTFVPQRKGGQAELAASLAPLAGEADIQNNAMVRGIRVIDEKIKVLYVEGKPRWEYRYLRAVLLRDPRLEVKFLMTQGDRDLARFAPQYLDRFPDDAAAFNFDMIILGDVPLSYFTPEQVARINKLVFSQNGSLLMLAGRKYAPMSYVGSAIGQMLPVEITRDLPLAVNAEAHPVPTSAGLASAAVTLEPSLAKNTEVWSQVHPLYVLPQLKAVKPGATVLAELSEAVGTLREKYPLVTWQRYGGGKVMFVASDQFWRLRLKQGDKYHARFWSQSIQFMSLSRLLGGNKRISIQTDRMHYQAGDRVQVFASVLTAAYEPSVAMQYMLTVQRAGAEKDAWPLRLEPVPDSPGMYQGFFAIPQDGNYTMRASPEDQPAANIPEFDARTVALEAREPKMQEQTLRKMAEISGGKYLALRQLPELMQEIGNEKKYTTVRLERQLWDLPVVFIGLVLLAGLEWFVRRRSHLI